MCLKRGRNVSFWLQADYPATSPARPVYPQQQTFWTRLGMSQVDPQETFLRKVPTRKGGLYGCLVRFNTPTDSHRVWSQ